MDEVLLVLQQEPSNIKDSQAVSRDEEHASSGTCPPKHQLFFPLTIPQFLSRNMHQAVLEVVGEKVNDGGCYGFDLAYSYRL